METVHSRGCVFAVEYHIVWCTKYSPKVIWPSVERKLHQILNEVADEQGVSIEEFNTDKDHLHMLLAATPYTDIPEMIKAMKGRAAYILFREFPWIKRYLWHGHLWSPSYFIATVSENTEEQVRHYIQTQKE